MYIKVAPWDSKFFAIYFNMDNGNKTKFGELLTNNLTQWIISLKTYKVHYKMVFWGSLRLPCRPIFLFGHKSKCNYFTFSLITINVQTRVYSRFLDFMTLMVFFYKKNTFSHCFFEIQLYTATPFINVIPELTLKKKVNFLLMRKMG